VRKDAIGVEDERLEGLDGNTYPWIHERHRIFPGVFESGRYKNVIDIAAGMGVVARRIKEGYPCRMLCNDINENCLKSLRQAGLETVSFDLDDPAVPFPLQDRSFDAVISLATLEHILHVDEHMREIRRILKDDGHLFLSTPNYSGIQFVIPFLFTGRTFHNPLKEGISRYEFYAHVRYFTYRTLKEFVESFGFTADIVYLALPEGSARYKALREKSRFLAFLFRTFMGAFYRVLSPRWAFHPVLRFSKTPDHALQPKQRKPRRVIL
jgi:2-polyprenyl-3-methyl-5-hydroxy-6-metoxy-1,4-benzoquinol methylase